MESDQESDATCKTPNGTHFHTLVHLRGNQEINDSTHCPTLKDNLLFQKIIILGFESLVMK